VQRRTSGKFMLLWKNNILFLGKKNKYRWIKMLLSGVTVIVVLFEESILSNDI
jgi:hypothetical protein